MYVKRFQMDKARAIICQAAPDRLPAVMAKVGLLMTPYVMEALKVECQPVHAHYGILLKKMAETKACGSLVMLGALGKKQRNSASQHGPCFVGARPGHMRIGPSNRFIACEVCSRKLQSCCRRLRLFPNSRPDCCGKSCGARAAERVRSSSRARIGR